MVRRALLLFRNMPPIEPSAEFAGRLQARLRAVRDERQSAAWIHRVGYTRRRVAAFAALAAGVVVAGFIGTSVFGARVARPALALSLSPVVVAASPPAAVERTIVGVRSPALVSDSVLSANAPAGPWGPTADPAFAASVTGMPVWAAAVLAAHSPPAGFPSPRLKLTNLER